MFNISQQSRCANASNGILAFFALDPHNEGALHHTSAVHASAHCRCTQGRMTCASQANAGSSLLSPEILANEGPGDQSTTSLLPAASLCSSTPALMGQTTSGRERGKALLLAQPDHERRMILVYTSKESGVTLVSGVIASISSRQSVNSCSLFWSSMAAGAIFIIGCTYKSIFL